MYGEAGNVPVNIALLPDGSQEKWRGIFEKEELAQILKKLPEATTHGREEKTPQDNQGGQAERRQGEIFDKAAAAERVKKILPILKKTYPDATIALHFTNPLELLIATILSAQCTDVRVNMVTPELFRKYKSAADWANADLKQIEQDIRTCGFYHNKAVSIQGAAARSSRTSAARSRARWRSSRPCPASAERPRMSCWAMPLESPPSPVTRTSCGCPAVSSYRSMRTIR